MTLSDELLVRPIREIENPNIEQPDYIEPVEEDETEEDIVNGADEDLGALDEEDELPLYDN
jgi:hypothetical protein